MAKQLKTGKRIHRCIIRTVRSALMSAGLCLVPQAPCLAVAPAEFKFTVKHFSVEGLAPLSQAAIDDYFKPLQNKSYTLKELQEVSKAFEQIIRKQGYPLYRVTVPPQTLDDGDIRLQVISVDALHCNLPTH